MSSDPNKKSARTFQCRDVLWETFEQMARELECSVDYLINEAMKQYARQRSYGSRTPFPAQQGGGGRNSDQGREREQSMREQGRESAQAYASNAQQMPAPTPPVAAPPQMRSSGLGAPTSRLPPPPMRPGSGIGGSSLPAP